MMRQRRRRRRQRERHGQQCGRLVRSDHVTPPSWVLKVQI
jgi:hypothetical protein